jgi:hypothetical protein
MFSKKSCIFNQLKGKYIMVSKSSIVVAFLIGSVILSCKRKDETFTSDPSARLFFEVASVKYDTLYSGLSYPTKRIKIFNTNSEALAIDQINLKGGVASFYKILVNGQAGPIVSNIELMGGDSMFVFIDLSFPAQNDINPYRIDDEIQFWFNGQVQNLPIRAVGEDAILVQPGDLPCAQVWDNQKAIILLGETVVPSGCSLTIQKGAKVLSKPGASLDVKGTLLVTGTSMEPVYIGSVAIGKNPGNWKGIRFYEGSSGHNLAWLYLANAETGLSFASPASASLVDIELNHAALFDFTLHAMDLSFVTLNASNCLFIASANSLASFSNSGAYTFNHCTWAGFSYDYYREGPCVKTRNVLSSLTLNLNNCIVWGDKPNEIELAPSTSAMFDNSILKTTASISGSGQLLNQDPQFQLAVNRDFKLQPTSPAIDAGVVTTVTDDLNAKSRDAAPDLGCFEYIP